MIAFAQDDKDEIWRLSVTSNIFLQQFGTNAHFGVLLERGGRGLRLAPSEAKWRCEIKAAETLFVD